MGPATRRNSLPRLARSATRRNGSFTSGRLSKCPDCRHPCTAYRRGDTAFTPASASVGRRIVRLVSSAAFGRQWDWEQALNQVQDAMQTAVGEQRWQENNPNELWEQDEELRKAVEASARGCGEKCATVPRDQGYPQKRTFALHWPMFALCQKATWSCSFAERPGYRLLHKEKGHPRGWPLAIFSPVALRACRQSDS